MQVVDLDFVKKLDNQEIMEDQIQEVKALIPSKEEKNEMIDALENVKANQSQLNKKL